MTAGLCRLAIEKQKKGKRQKDAGDYIAPGHSFLHASRKSIASILKPKPV
ncbi:hypothetical protein SAMN05216412_10139 [Nitrosospira multiformis]|uniref:Uncharacterized protein n=1 Tax=Nitrosospira multiformis TaxID=1231 RepID=A0A1H9Y4M8_9PROT|nr:hypothetical protein SAMN05216412_10139 [Nitrosospira multiformis]